MKIFISKTEIYDLVRLPVLLSILFSATFFLGIIAIPNADAAVDMFLKIDGIPGESTDSVHKGEIEVLAWSWGMSNSGSTHTGPGGSTGTVNIQDLSVTKFLDKSSPFIFLKCANGEHIPSAKLTVRKAGGEKSGVEFFTLEMENMIFSSVSTGGSSGEDRLTENITLNFSKVTWTYTETESDGSPKGSPIPGGWDIVEGKKV